MSQWPSLLNIIGLVADMSGVIGLFFTRVKGLSKINGSINVDSFKYAASRVGGDGLTKAFEAFAGKINGVIKQALDENNAAQRRRTAGSSQSFLVFFFR